MFCGNYNFFKFKSEPTSNGKKNILGSAKEKIIQFFKNDKKNLAMPNFLEEAKEKATQQLTLKYIILDCSCINYIDNQGVDTLIQVNFEIFSI